MGAQSSDKYVVTLQRRKRHVKTPIGKTGCSIFKKRQWFVTWPSPVLIVKNGIAE